MKPHNSAASRILPLLGALAVAGAVINVVIWAQTEPSHISYVGPIRALEIISRQIGSASFEHFNSKPLFSIFVFAMWLFPVWAVGGYVCRRTLPQSTLPEERLLFEFAAGFVLSGLALFALGIAHLATDKALGMVWLAGVILGYSSRSRIAKLELPPPVRLPFSKFAFRNFCSLLALICVIGSFIYALTPPIQSDAMRYHLAAPQEYLKAGKIGYLPHNAFSNFPFLVEMHFMFVLDAPETTQLMHWTLYLTVALAVYAFIRRFVEPLFLLGPERVGVTRAICVLMYLTAPASLILSAWPFIDHAVTLYLFCTLYALLLAFEFGGKRLYILVGLMAGGAVGTKYTALPFLAIPPTILLVEWIAFSPPLAANSRRTIRPKVLAYALLALALTSAPWFLKNLALTGNPVYPLANSHFHGGDWTAASASLYANHVASKGIPKTIAGLFASPMASTFGWPKFEQHYLGPTLLVAIIGGIIGSIIAISQFGPRSRPIVYMQVTAIGYYLLWFFSYQSNRMLLPFIAFSLPGLACLLLECLSWQIWLFRALVTILIGGATHSALWALQWIYAVPPSPPPLTYLLGSISRDEYLSKSLTYYRAYQQELNFKKSDSKVLLIGEHRIFYADFPAIWSDWYDTPAVVALMRDNKISTVPRFIDFLRRNKIETILQNNAELKLQDSWRPRFSDSEWQLLTDLLNSDQFTKQVVPPGVTIYKLKSK